MWLPWTRWSMVLGLAALGACSGDRPTSPATYSITGHLRLTGFFVNEDGSYAGTRVVGDTDTTQVDFDVAPDSAYVDVNILDAAGKHIKNLLSLQVRHAGAAAVPQRAVGDQAPVVRLFGRAGDLRREVTGTRPRTPTPAPPAVPCR